MLGKRFVLNLQYNGSNRFLIINTSKMYKFKAKDSEIKLYLWYVGNISKEFTNNKMKKKLS